MAFPNLDKEQLCELLQSKGLERSIAEKLRDEDFDGETFQDITAALLRDCNFKGSEIVRIMKLHPLQSTCEEMVVSSEVSDTRNNGAVTQNDKTESCALVPYHCSGQSDEDAGASTNPCGASFLSHSSVLVGEEVDAATDNESDELEEQQGAVSKSGDALNLSGTSGSECDSDALNQYFSNAELLDMDEYEKRNHKRNLQRWRRSVNDGASFSHLLRPTFVRAYEKAQEAREEKLKRAAAKNACTASTSAPVVRPQRKCKVSVSQQRAPAVLDSQPGPSCSRPATSSHREEVSTDSEGTPQDVPMRPTPNLELQAPKRRRISRIDRTVEIPSFDIQEIFDELSEDGDDTSFEAAINRLKSGEILEKKERKLVMRVLTNHLHYSYVRDPKLVTPAMKDGIAKSFVEAYPQYKSDVATVPWGGIYDRETNTGFLTNSSRRIQKKNRVRKNAKRDKQPITGDGKELDETALEVLNVTLPGRAEKAEILEGMAKSFEMRNRFREEGRTVHDFLTSFVHFSSYDGEVVREEFKRMFPTRGDFTKAFLEKQAKILSLPVLKALKLECNDDVLKALLLLSQHLPYDVRRKGDRSGAPATLSLIVQIVKASDDIEKIVKDKIEEGSVVQPYLIAVKALLTDKLSRYHLVLDGKIIDLRGCTAVKAIEYLLQVYFIFNVSYPIGWRNTFHALATLFYKIFEKTGPGQRKDKITPSESELWTKLSS